MFLIILSLFAVQLTAWAGNPFKAFSFSDPFPSVAQVGAAVQPAQTILFNESLLNATMPYTRPLPAGVNQGLKAISIEWWMKQKRNGTGNPDGTLFHGPGFTLNGDWQQGANGAMIAAFCQAKGGQYIGTRGVTIPLGSSDEQWHYYVVTYDLRQVSTYIDGELVMQTWLDNNADRFGPMEDDSNRMVTSVFEAGGGGVTSGRHFSGAAIDTLRISSVALNPWEIRRNFESARVYQKTIYASPSGNGANPGTLAQPLSLRGALAQAGSATKIVLLPGTYPGADFVLNRSGSSPRDHCLITGADGAAAVLIEGGIPTVQGAGYIVLRNLTFSGDQSALNVNNASARVVIDACRFTGQQQGLTVSASPGVVVQNCLVKVGNIGMHVVNSLGTVLKNNTIVDGRVGVQLDTGSRAISFLNNLLKGQNSACVVVNNAQREYRGDGNVYNPQGTAAAVLLNGTRFTPAQVQNKALSQAWYNQDVADASDARQRRIGHCAEGRSLATAAEFVDAAAGDYRLRRVIGNPLDAGADRTFQRAIIPALYDITGARRPQGFAVDAGAFEGEPAAYATFVLDREYTTSAGVFKADGTLVRTLFSGLRRSPGTNVIYWNGLDDQNQTVPAGEYRIKMIAHNVEYVWEGVVGNTSQPNSGKSVHAHFEPIKALAIFGNTAIYTPGYNEGKYELFRFDVSNPNFLTQNFGPMHGIYSDAAVDLATDGNRIFTVNSRLCAVYNFGDGLATRFGNGTTVNVGNAGPGAIEVQRNGNLMFVARKNDNRVYVLDKNSGGAIGSFAVTRPGDLALTANGELWVVCSINGQGAAARYTTFNGAAPAAVISGLQKPVAIAVSPVDGTVLIADAGSHQLQAYTAAGAPLWTYGQAGGYANGPRVTADKFGFYYKDNEKHHDASWLAFQDDGSFWVADMATSRYLRFNPQRQLLNSFSYVPHTYTASVDANNPTRVFNRYLEYLVDYSKPLGQSWVLTNFWGHNLPAYAFTFADGIFSAITLNNGRTYGLIHDGNPGSTRQVVELTPTGLRETPSKNLNVYTIIEKDGSITSYTLNGTRVTFQRRTLTGFDSAHNPQWSTPVDIGSASAGNEWLDSDPVGRFPRLTGDLIISFDPARERNGWHLGALKRNSDQWLWKASPSAGGLQGDGHFETWAEYGGNLHFTAGRSIFFGFHGEFFLDQGQANQFMHFYDNGLFVGQFGQPMLFGVTMNAPGAAGNAFSPIVVEVGSDVYLYNNDESSRGSHRWKAEGIKDIRELTSAITIGEAPTNSSGSAGEQVTGPDLVVLTVAAEPAAASAGAPVRFTATIKNQGNAPTPVGLVIGVGFYVDGGEDYTTGGNPKSWGILSSNLPPGAIAVVRASDGPESGLWTATGRSHRISAIVDIPNRIPETNEVNNALVVGYPLLGSEHLDSDNDNVCDSDEIFAGTDPQDRSSVLKLTSIKTDAGGVTASWCSIPGKVYRLHYKDAFSESSWKPLSGEITATGSSTRFTDTNGLSTMRLYSVSVVR